MQIWLIGISAKLSQNQAHFQSVKVFLALERLCPPWRAGDEVSVYVFTVPCQIKYMSYLFII